MPCFPLSRQLTLQHSAWCCVVPSRVVLQAPLLVGPVQSAPAAGSPGRSVQGAVLHALNAMQPTCAGSTAALWGASAGKN